MLVSKRLRTLVWLVTLLLFVLPCYSQKTLREDLQSDGIPISSFSKAELDEAVDGAGGSKQPYVYFVYVRRNGNSLSGLPHLLRYDQNTGAILRSELQVDKEDECCGAPGGIEFVDGYLLLSFHYNPSASTILVLDHELRLVELLYGFGATEVAPNQIVLTEGMMHFAPIHAERLQFVDLHTGSARELFPIKNDALRKQFILEHKKRMPSIEICRQSDNDYCDPEMFDEGVMLLGTDGHGSFALLAKRDASHITEKNGDVVIVASQSALYIYKQDRNGWLYCEESLSEEEASAFDYRNQHYFGQVASRCNPNLAVVPDISTSDLSPFPSPSRRVK